MASTSPIFAALATNVKRQLTDSFSPNTYD